jgi:hypothetical protein
MVLSQMHQTNLMEIAVGKIAQDKASMMGDRSSQGLRFRHAAPRQSAERSVGVLQAHADPETTGKNRIR